VGLRPITSARLRDGRPVPYGEVSWRCGKNTPPARSRQIMLYNENASLVKLFS
jgi:hypothetical protein